jgi:hypothetical protein
MSRGPKIELLADVGRRKPASSFRLTVTVFVASLNVALVML